MMELSMEDFMIAILSVAILLIGFLRIVSKWRRDHTRSKQRKGIFYCNVCVQYIPGEASDKEVSCPCCERRIPRGRKRNLS